MFREKFRQLFVPHEGNNFCPDVLERFSMMVMLFLVLLTFAMANMQALVWVGSEWMASSILPAVIVELTNDERVDETLGVLTRNNLLDEAARLKAEDMAKNGYFAHESPSGITPWYWFDEIGYNYLHAGENLAVHFTDSSDVVEGWMKSPLHKANILNIEYTEIGVGTARGTYKGIPTIFVVQLFGTPRAHAEVLSTPSVAQSETSPTVKPAVAETSDTRVLGEQLDVVTVSLEGVPVDVVPEVVAQLNEPIETALYSGGTQNGDTVLYTDTVSTSRVGMPGTVTSPQENGVSGETTFLEKSATQPHAWLQIVYGILASLVVLTLSTSLAYEWRRKNVVHIAYAGGLLVVMALLYSLHTTLTSGVSIV